MTTRPYTDDYLVEYSAEHLYYEVRMLFEMVNRLKEQPVAVTPAVMSSGAGAMASRGAAAVAVAVAPPPMSELRLPPAERNAFIESFMAHLSHLIDFLFNEHPGPTDVVAADFCAGSWQPRRAEWLSVAKTRLEDELAPLTTRRISGSPSRKRWEVESIAEEMRDLLLQFVEQASTDRLSMRARTLIATRP